MAEPQKFSRNFQIYVNVPWISCNLCHTGIGSSFNPFGEGDCPEVTITRTAFDGYYPQFRTVGDLDDEKLLQMARDAGWLLELPGGVVVFCPACQKKYGIAGPQQ